MRFCSNCGAELTADAQFCPRCGKPAPTVAPAAAPPPPRPVAAQAPVPPHTPRATPAAAPKKGAPWWIVPLVIVGIVIIAWLILAGLPFRRESAGVEQPAMETVGEGTAPPPSPQPTGTIVDMGANGTVTTGTTATTVTTGTTAPPRATTQTVPPPATATAPPPVLVEDRPQAPPVETPPAPRGEISEEEASAVLRGYVTSRSYYEGVPTQCVQVRSSGYRNRGYGFSVWSSCVSGGGSRMLGRWRVDSETREVFVQKEDGRYLSP